ncbi:MAG: hypothetical protein DRJ40_04920 [Thermoprotei archaeon]|nr:MAG: hypothetical protein DRJ40_04605 [Thermoprotei archaeon]RLE56742.1 MAG: hypothetical protein DRJ40_04920 [Thermoprotei archaeon]
MGELNGVKSLELLVLVDNTPGREELRSAWGLSILLKTDSYVGLFDTGPDPYTLQHNMDVLGIDPKSLSFIVISHDHWDHVGGLRYLAESGTRCNVFIPSSAIDLGEWLQRHGFIVTRVDSRTEVAQGTTVFLLGNFIDELSMVVTVKNFGGVLLVGCSHPGIERIVETAHGIAKRLRVVIGGMHLLDASEDRLRKVVNTFEQYSIDEVYAIHCTGDVATEYFREKLPSYRVGFTGLVLRYGTC